MQFAIKILSGRALYPATNPRRCSSNEEELEDDDTTEDSSVKARNRDLSDINSEIAEPSPGPSGSSETQQADAEERMLDDNDDKMQWPTVTDLNTRLRRVITSYQRSYRKEEQKLAAAKAKVCIFPDCASLDVRFTSSKSSCGAVRC